ncbi:MAG TPA: tetratricopeptide repeat protein [Candidatus Methylacidiphilales bacterium]|nr:tetratricopeptide repeat protein [Candidatus Methylacidiphilales bacterium]
MKRRKKTAHAAPSPFRLTPQTVRLLLCAGLIASVAIVYAQVYSFDFFSDDDPQYITHNPDVKSGLSWHGLWWACTTEWAGNWQPLTWLSYQIDYQLWGPAAGPYHITNLLFHAANSVLLFLALQRMTGAMGRSALAAGLFALHPLHVESVAWIAERKDVLSGFFWILALGAYIRYAEKPTIPRYAVVGALFILALLSKTMSITLPFVMVLLDFWPLGRTPWNGSGAGSPRRFDWRRLILEKLPFLALAIVPSLLIFQAQSHFSATASFSVVPLTLRIENCLISYVRYIGLFLYPSDLSYYYPYAVWKPFVAVGAGLILMVISALVVWRVKTEPYLLVGWLWFVGVLFPVNGLVQVGIHAMNDHYTYLPSIGLGIMVAWGGYDLMRKLPGWPAPALATAVLVVYAGLTARQVSFWQNGLTLYQHELALNKFGVFADHYIAWSLVGQGRDDVALAGGPADLPKTAALDYIYENIGTIYLFERNDLINAAGALEEAIRLQPGNAKAHANLGVVYDDMGRSDDARAEEDTAIKLNPHMDAPHYNLGNLDLEEKNMDQAVAEYRIAEELLPGHAATHSNLGSALYQLGRLDEAEKEIRIALDLDPSLVEARFNLGNILLRENNLAQAVDVFDQLIKDQPNDPEVYFDRALALTRLGRLSEAEDDYRTVLKLNPQSAAGYNGLGNLLGRENKPEDAIVEFQQALRINPDFAIAHYNLAITLKNLGRLSEAQKEFDLARSLSSQPTP